MTKRSYNLVCVVAIAVFGFLEISFAATRYVVPTNSGASFPYTSWATAAVNIQDAIDASGVGDLVLVTNGIYATGGRIVAGSMTNRVAITNAVTVQSVNGPSVTIIQGNGIMGDAAVRCVYVGSNCAVNGFTLTNGTTRTAGNIDSQNNGGGVWSEVGGVVSNCVVVNNSAFYRGGGAFQGTLIDCTIVGNASTNDGGGVWGCSLFDCIITSNNAKLYGGGVSMAKILSNCLVACNSSVSGGGVYGGVLYNCTVFSNSASAYGGGVYSGILYNCSIFSNSAKYNGGGIYDGALSNCTVFGNTVPNGNGGGVYNGALISRFLSNCSVFSNSASGNGGGIYNYTLYKSTLSNCTIFGNSAANGGGIYDLAYSVLYDCQIVGNSVGGDGSSGGKGGGVYWGVLYNCTLFGNRTTNTTTRGTGGGAYSSKLFGSIIASNSVTGDGGGVYSCILSQCMVVGNTSTMSGGGAYNCNLTTCRVTCNSASNNGGGIYGGYLYNSTVSGNSALDGGGVYYFVITSNSVVYGNNASTGPNYNYNCTFGFSCTTPDPGGTGNISVDPKFVDNANGNYRLATNSPCIDAGTNRSWMTTSMDIEGKPRILGLRVDIGAYEFIPLAQDSDADGIPDWWEWQYDHSFTNLAATEDLDSDGLNNMQEYLAGTDPTKSDTDGDGMSDAKELIAGTDPTNSLSCFRLISLTCLPTNLIVIWQSASNHTYNVVRSSDLLTNNFLTVLATNLPATPPDNVYTDSTVTNLSSYFYMIITK